MAKAEQHRKVLAKCRYVRQKGCKEEKWALVVDGKLVGKTSVPNGKKEIWVYTLRKMMAQMRLSEEEYGPFYACTSRYSDYIAILEQKGVIGR